MTEAPALSADLRDELPSLAALDQELGRLAQKPYVVIAGPFDAGKTRIANTLLGSRRLPEKYQPTTSIVTYLRHIEDRPEWFKEDVWIMRRGFEPHEWDSEEHCLEQRLVAGSFDSLWHYGVHGGIGEDEGWAALAFVDSPILRSCTLVDLPGEEAYPEDRSKADIAVGLADILLYVSPANGFLRLSDLSYLSILLRNLRHPETWDKAFPILGNLFVVATRADGSIDDFSLSEILDGGARRIHSHLRASVFQRIEEQVGHPISYQDLRSRYFTFWYELPERRFSLEVALKRVLSIDCPRARTIDVDKRLQVLRSSLRTKCNRSITSYRNLLEGLADARRLFREFEEQAPVRGRMFRTKKRCVLNLIDDCRVSTRAFVLAEIAPMMEPKAIEEFISGEFDRASDAREYAGLRIMEQVQSRLDGYIREKSSELAREIDAYLESYDLDWDLSAIAPGHVSVPFDAKSAFLSGLAGAATLGALATWAATLGNLGGYILVAKLVSLLAAVGISVGGTASAVGIVAAIGGPVTLALFIAGVLVIGVWAAFSESWKVRLAKKLAKLLKEKRVVTKLERKLDRFWEDTRVAFELGAREVELRYEESRERLRKMANEQNGFSRNAIEERLGKLLEFFEFLAHLPWERMTDPCEISAPGELTALPTESM